MFYPSWFSLFMILESSPTDFLGIEVIYWKCMKYIQYLIYLSCLLEYWLGRCTLIRFTIVKPLNLISLTYTFTSRIILNIIFHWCRIICLSLIITSKPTNYCILSCKWRSNIFFISWISLLILFNDPIINKSST